MRAGGFRTILTVPAALFASAGCGHRDLVGEWESVGLRPLVLRFERGGRYTVSTPVVEGAVATGTYRLEGSRLTLVRPTLRLGAERDDRLDFAGRWAERLAGGQWQLSWKSDDEIVLNGDGLLSGGYKRRR